MKALMKTKKLGRFADGGEVDGSDLGAFNEGPSGGAAADSDAPAPKATSFKEAFAAARKGGAKTFEYKGKKYTTEMASAKPASRPSAPSSDSSRSLSQGLGEKYAAIERAHRRAPANTSSAAYESLTRARDDAKSAYEKAAESERTGKSVVKLASGGLVRRAVAKSHGKAC